MELFFFHFYLNEHEIWSAHFYERNKGEQRTFNREKKKLMSKLNTDVINKSQFLGTDGFFFQRYARIFIACSR